MSNHSDFGDFEDEGPPPNDEGAGADVDAVGPPAAKKQRTIHDAPGFGAPRKALSVRQPRRQVRPPALLIRTLA